MEILPAVAVLMALSLGFSALFRRRIDETLPVSMLAVTAILYAAGLASRLPAGLWIAAAFAAAGLVLFAVRAYRGRGAFIRPLLLTPGLAVFGFWLLFLIFLQHGRVLVGWDEMSHWGIAAKDMFLHNRFGAGADSSLLFRDYPPGAAVFEYFCLKLSGGYRDSVVLTGFGLLMLSPLLIVFRGLSWRDGRRLVLRLAVVMALPLVFYSDYRISVADFYTTIYVDPLLGILFGTILIAWFSESLDGFNTLRLSLALFVLTILKASGFDLALIFLLVAGGQAVIVRRGHLSGLFGRRSWRLALLPASAAAAECSWKIVLAVNHTPKEFSAGGFSFPALLAVLIGRGAPYTREVLRNFGTALLVRPLAHLGIAVPVGAAVFTAAAVALIALLARMEDTEEKKRRIAATGGLLIFFSLLYAAGLLFLYLFSFNSTEAVSLASYGRYLNTYFLGMLLFLLDRLLQTGPAAGWRKRAFWAVLACLLAVTDPVPFVKDGGAALLGNRHSVESRAPYDVVAQQVNSRARLDGIQTPRLYYIDASAANYGYLAVKYCAAPDPVNGYDSWPADDQDPQTLPGQLAAGYDYVYVFSADDVFRNRCAGLFEGGAAAVRDRTLYRVVKQGGTVRLAACGA